MVVSAELAGTEAMGERPLREGCLRMGAERGAHIPLILSPSKVSSVPSHSTGSGKCISNGVERSVSWGLWERMGPVLLRLPYAQVASLPQMCCWSQEPSRDSPCKHRGYFASLISSRG